MTKLDDQIIAKNILMTVATYGLQKTSMNDLARVVGVTRQSIYKKYGSKDACYAQSVNEYLSWMYGEIFKTLNSEQGDVRETLVAVFDILIGEAIEMISSAHGTEVLDTVLAATLNSEEDWRIRFRTRLGDFLHRKGIVSSEAKGIDMAMVLIAASKGILLEESSLEQFRIDMGKIIDALLFSE